MVSMRQGPELSSVMASRAALPSRIIAIRSICTIAPASSSHVVCMSLSAARCSIEPSSGVFCVWIIGETTQSPPTRMRPSRQTQLSCDGLYSSRGAQPGEKGGAGGVSGRRNAPQPRCGEDDRGED